MNNWLLLILSIIGLLALYWVLAGQWRYNKMMGDAIEPDSSSKAEKKDEQQN